MSKLDHFNDLLKQYHELAYHQNPKIAKRLFETQNWLKSRIRITHQSLFSAPEHRLMAEYFLNRLYGSRDFDILAEQIERLLRYAHKAEKLLPDNAIKTGTQSVSLALLSLRLDEQVALQLLQDYPEDAPIEDEMMRLTLLKLDQKEQRLHQLELLDHLGLSLDKYMRSFMMYAAFKMCRGAATKYHFDQMYSFIQEGFEAMKPIKSAQSFIAKFSQAERNIIEKVHANHPHPFDE